MSNSEEFKELKKVYGSLDDHMKMDILDFVRFVKEQEGYDHIEHFFEGFNGLMKNVSVLMKINELLGDDLDMIVRFDPDEEDLKHSDFKMFKERSDLLVRFAKMLQAYEEDTWTPMIKARFEKGLEDLEKFIVQGDLSDRKTEEIRADQG